MQSLLEDFFCAAPIHPRLAESIGPQLFAAPLALHYALLARGWRAGAGVELSTAFVGAAGEVEAPTAEEEELVGPKPVEYERLGGFRRVKGWCWCCCCNCSLRFFLLLVFFLFFSFFLLFFSFFWCFLVLGLLLAWVAVQERVKYSGVLATDSRYPRIPNGDCRMCYNLKLGIDPN